MLEDKPHSIIFIECFFTTVAMFPLSEDRFKQCIISFSPNLLKNIFLFPISNSPILEKVKTEEQELGKDLFAIITNIRQGFYRIAIEVATKRPRKNISTEKTVRECNH